MIGLSAQIVYAPRTALAASRKHFAPRVVPAKASKVLRSRPDPRTKLNSGTYQPRPTSVQRAVFCRAQANAEGSPFSWQGLHHCGFICENLERSLEFYCGKLGLEINESRPDDKLPYRGAWLWIADDMIHLMELPNPDPTELSARPDHGGRDRHICVGIEDVAPLAAMLDKHNIHYTASKSGRPAIFFRDPDSNTIEVGQALSWKNN
eukprot:CAMPEP_0118957466 /NCGR_PEP_ID=MMETSP1169-20130426/62120_1 /TAXON_ID=36882 /ORGANISM="Pyramimonas obovata, Strain CCMP722" /LENGTH=206 /DNA_ID=CAMNT_0006905549 /DNA_START=589 /DNA_END=1209 /DNA_ORIENTATION=+